MARVRLIYHESEMEHLLRNPRVLDNMLDLARPIVRSAQAMAPRRTGAGAASIHGQSGVDARGSFVRISWDREHYYMGFQNLGTRYIVPRRFLESALERYER